LLPSITKSRERSAHAARDEVLEKGLAHVLVLGGALVQAEHVLVALLIDAECDGDQMIADVDAGAAKSSACT
jgi:hypothetical protein